MGDDVRILKRKKRRGDDPRLDALAEERARDAETTPEGARKGGKKAPGLIASGGMDEARVHVVGIAPPAKVDHATLEMQRVVVRGEGADGDEDEDEGEGDGEDEGEDDGEFDGAVEKQADAGRDDGARRVVARWRMVAIAAGVVAIASSAALFVRSSLRGGSDGSGEQARATTGSSAEAVRASESVGRADAGAVGVAVTPGGPVASGVPGGECVEAGATTAGAVEAARCVDAMPAAHAATAALPSRSPARAPVSASPSTSPRTPPSASPEVPAAPNAAPSAPGTSGAPVPDTSSVEF